MTKKIKVGVTPTKKNSTHHIRNSETEFHFSHADIDNMSDEELEQYVDYLDALWLK